MVTIKVKRSAFVLLTVLFVFSQLSIARYRQVPEYRSLWIGPSGGDASVDSNWEKYVLGFDQMDSDPNVSELESYLINWTSDSNSPNIPDLNSYLEIKDSCSVNIDTSLTLQGLIIRDGTATVGSGTVLEVVGDSTDNGFMNLSVGQGTDGTLIIEDGATLMCGDLGALSGQTGMFADDPPDGKCRFMVGRPTANPDPNIPGDSAVGTVIQYGGDVICSFVLELGTFGRGEIYETLARNHQPPPESWDDVQSYYDNEWPAKFETSAQSSGSSYTMYGGNLIGGSHGLILGKRTQAACVFNQHGGYASFNTFSTSGGSTYNLYDGTLATSYFRHGSKDCETTTHFNMYSGTLDINGEFRTCRDGSGSARCVFMGGSLDVSGLWHMGGNLSESAHAEFLFNGDGDFDGSIHEDAYFCGDSTLDDGVTDTTDITLILPENPTASQILTFDSSVYLGYGVTMYVDVNDANTFNWSVGDSWDVAEANDFQGLEDTAFVNTACGYIFSPSIVDMGSYQVLRITLENTGDCTDVEIQTAPEGITTVEPSPGIIPCTVGSTIELSASRYVNCPDVYEFSTWSSNVNEPNASNTTYTVPAGDSTVTATFVDDRTCGDECHPVPEYDGTGDCRVNLLDFAELASDWMESTVGFVSPLDDPYIVYIPFDGEDNGIDSDCWKNWGSYGTGEGPGDVGTADAPTATVTSDGLKGGAFDLTAATGQTLANTYEWGDNSPDLSYNDTERVLANNWSFTWTGWLKSNTPDTGGQGRILRTPGFTVNDRGYAMMFLIGDNFGGNWYTCPINLNMTEWTFVAMTYDGTGADDVLKIYKGTETSPVTLVDTFIEQGQDQLTRSGDGAPLFIGNSTASADRPFDGYIDEFRVWGRRNENVNPDPSGALTLEELETVRQYDIDPVLEYDFTGDYTIDFRDVAEMASGWLDCTAPECD